MLSNEPRSSVVGERLNLPTQITLAPSAVRLRLAVGLEEPEHEAQATPIGLSVAKIDT